MNLQTFTLEEIKREIRRELEMRRRVWPTVSGMPERFISMEHQRKYDILKQLSEVLDHGNKGFYNVLRESAETAKTIEAQNLNKPNLFTS